MQSLGSVFLSGGADGSVRVWARGSLAGGGPSPLSEVPGPSNDAPLRSFDEEITRGVGVGGDDAQDRRGDDGDGHRDGEVGISSKEEEMQKLLEGGILLPSMRTQAQGENRSGSRVRPRPDCVLQMRLTPAPPTRSALTSKPGRHRGQHQVIVFVFCEPGARA